MLLCHLHRPEEALPRALWSCSASTHAARLACCTHVFDFVFTIFLGFFPPLTCVGSSYLCLFLKIFIYSFFGSSGSSLPSGLFSRYGGQGAALQLRRLLLLLSTGSSADFNSGSSRAQYWRFPFPRAQAQELCLQA